MTREHYYIIKFTEENGWEIDEDNECGYFPEGSIYDSKTGWEFGYQGEGVFAKDEERLSEEITLLLEHHNTMSARLINEGATK
jgi:hypothetical protein